MVNSWKLYQKVNRSNISQLNFLSEVTMALLKFGSKKEADDEDSPLNRMTKGQRIQHLPDPFRKNGMNHFPIPKDKPTRCAV